MNQRLHSEKFKWIVDAYRGGEISYIQAITELEELSFLPREAEEVISDIDEGLEV